MRVSRYKQYHDIRMLPAILVRAVCRRHYKQLLRLLDKLTCPAGSTIKIVSCNCPKGTIQINALRNIDHFRCVQRILGYGIFR
jgi:hypothetical protein